MTRKSHIKRITGKSKSPSGGRPVDEPDVYVDVARIDTLDTVEWPGAQENQINLLWDDAPGESGNPGRRMGTVKLIDPEETNRDDPAVWIDLPVIERMTLVRHPGAQEQVTSFQPSSADPQADELETARRVAIRRITHAESNVDAQLAASNYLADADGYTRKADTIDGSQYLDVEIIESYPSTLHQGPSPQEVLVSMINDDLKEMFSAPPNDAKRNPVRLDPFQNIVNVQWGGGATEVEAGATIAQFCTLPETPKLSISMWVRVPENLPGMLPILQFAANEMLPPPYVPSSVIYAGAGGILCAFRSAMTYDSNDLVSCYDNQGNYLGQTLPNGDNSCAIQFQVGLPDSSPNVSNGDQSFVDGRWNHIAISLDASSSTVHGLLESTMQGARGRYDSSFVLNRISHDAPPGGVSVGLLANTFGNNQPGTGYLFADVPNFALNLNGYFGLPVQPVNASSSLGDGWPFSLNNFDSIEYAAVQIWTDQYIDFSDPDVLAKFVVAGGDSPSDASVNGIRMISPAVAQATFGKSTFFFDGPPSKFATNRGSGGEFTKTGELKSFRPAPPKAPTS